MPGYMAVRKDHLTALHREIFQWRAAYKILHAQAMRDTVALHKFHMERQREVLRWMFPGHEVQP